LRIRKPTFPGCVRILQALGRLRDVLRDLQDARPICRGFQFDWFLKRVGDIITKPNKPPKSNFQIAANFVRGHKNQKGRDGGLVIPSLSGVRRLFSFSHAD
jgi:predicted secreted protein